MKWIASVGILLPILFAAGCQRYEALSLNTTRVPATRPDGEEISRRAALLEHPILSANGIDLAAAIEESGLTPESAAIIAVINNLALRVERQHRSLAAAQLLQAGLLPNPSLEGTLEPVTGGNTLGSMTAYSVGLNWEISALIARDAKVAAAEAQSVRITLDVAWQEWITAQSARKAVFDAIALRDQLAATLQVDQQLSGQARTIRDAVEARQKTIVDASVGDAASAKAHADYLQTRRDFHRQLLMLKQSLGFPADAELKLAETNALPASFTLPSETALIHDLEFQRLDLVALRFGYASQEQSLRTAILAQFPKVVLGVHPASDNTGVHSVGIGISVDIPIFDRNQGAIASAKATRQQLFEEFNSRVFESRSVVAQTLADMKELTEQISAAEATLPAAQKLVDVYHDALARHEVDAFSAASAQNDLLSKQIDLLKLKQQLADDEVALELATGRSLSRYKPGALATRPALPETP